MKNLIRAILLGALCAPLAAQTTPAQSTAPASSASSAQKTSRKTSAKKNTQPANSNSQTSNQEALNSPPVVIRGGKLLTITHGVIENGSVVMENGKITAIGPDASVHAPAGAKIYDAKGMTVYPGLIDSQSYLGLTEISAVNMTNDMSEPSDEIMPHMRTADAFHAESEVIPVTRINGITNAIIAPASGDTLPGQMSFIQLAGRDRDEMIMVPDISMPLFFTPQQKRKDKYPSTRMGMAAQLRQVFIDAQDYAAKLDDYNKKSDKDKGAPPKRDLKLESLVPYLQGKKPVVLSADESSDLKVALQIAKEFNLRVILMGLTHTQNMLDEIAATKYPVVLGPIYDAPKGGERYDTVYSLPGQLVKRGVKVAFASYDAHQSRNLPYAAGYAVAYGLPYDEAMKAVTLNAAEIWGLGDKLGSLDVGKMGNVVIANGDPLDVKTDVKQVFIAGRAIPMESRQTKLRDAYMAR